MMQSLHLPMLNKALFAQPSPSARSLQGHMCVFKKKDFLHRDKFIDICLPNIGKIFNQIMCIFLN
jgi:hypothetical protein